VVAQYVALSELKEKYVAYNSRSENTQHFYGKISTQDFRYVLNLELSRLHE
jgi:protein involved in ribonucleotide reduction